MYRGLTVFPLPPSANLSKAAWGAFEKKETQLMIRSYEMGVLLFPDSDEIRLDLPYDLPLTPYEAGDEMWTWDTVHRKPDSHGQSWIPS